MKLRIGDKVRFLNEVGEGVVSRIKDHASVYVEMADGFEIPYQVSQLVPIHTELIVDKDAENIGLNPGAHIADAIYFVLEPDHDYMPLVNDFKVYLFNASAFNLSYTYAIKDGAYFQAIRHGEAGPYQKVLLRQVKLPFFNEYSEHKIEALLYKNTYYKPQLPLSHVVYVNERLLKSTPAVKHEEFKHPVYAFLMRDEFINTETVRQELSHSDLDKLRNVKEFKTAAKLSKSTRDYLKSLEKEVDLHIEELVDSTEGLSNHEMLSMQLDRVEKELDEAMVKKLKRIIFIHGVGNGRLRQEIQAILRNTPGTSFCDAPYKDYGYGATQVDFYG